MNNKKLKMSSSITQWLSLHTPKDLGFPFPPYFRSQFSKDNTLECLKNLPKIRQHGLLFPSRKHTFYIPKKCAFSPSTLAEVRKGILCLMLPLHDTPMFPVPFFKLFG